MFSRTWISKSTEGYSQKGERLKAEIQGADASLIGAGSGLSTSAGLTYGGERFLKYFSDFHEKYGITDMYSGGFYPFPSLEEYWAWWSRHIYCNRYDVTPGKPYMPIGNRRKISEISTDFHFSFRNANHCLTLQSYICARYEEISLSIIFCTPFGRIKPSLLVLTSTRTHRKQIILKSGG